MPLLDVVSPEGEGDISIRLRSGRLEHHSDGLDDMGWIDRRVREWFDVVSVVFPFFLERIYSC